MKIQIQETRRRRVGMARSPLRAGVGCAEPAFRFESCFPRSYGRGYDLLVCRCWKHAVDSGCGGQGDLPAIPEIGFLTKRKRFSPDISHVLRTAYFQVSRLPTCLGAMHRQGRGCSAGRRFIRFSRAPWLRHNGFVAPVLQVCEISGLGSLVQPSMWCCERSC